MAFTSQSDSRTNCSFPDSQALTSPDMLPYYFFQPSTMSNNEPHPNPERSIVSAWSQLQAHNELFGHDSIDPSAVYAPNLTNHSNDVLSAS